MSSRRSITQRSGSAARRGIRTIVIIDMTHVKDLIGTSTNRVNCALMPALDIDSIGSLCASGMRIAPIAQ